MQQSEVGSVETGITHTSLIDDGSFLSVKYNITKKNGLGRFFVDQ